jgi:hydroxymethylbilane synthase
LIVRIATRRSKLALAQSHWVKGRLETLEPRLTVELREYVTRGDRIQNVPLAQVGGKGLFTREIEDALLAGEADVAVHSLKDLPAEMPAGLTLGAVPGREDPRDALVLPVPLREGMRPGGLDALPERARVGSSSLRRTAQLLRARPDLRLEDVRGNVDTRLRKLDEGEYDVLVLAAAGLNRLGLAVRISAAIPVAVCTPAPGQGALGLQCRVDDGGTLSLLSRLEDPGTRACVTAERALMDTLGGGCSVPLGALATVEGDGLRLVGVVAAPDGSRILREAAGGSPGAPEALGRAVAEKLIAAGAHELLRPAPAG